MIIVFGEHASRNLGDQALSDAVAEDLSQIIGESNVARFALVNYMRFEESQRATPTVVDSGVLKSHRSRLARSQAARRIRARLLRRRLPPVLHGAELVVIGGGALLQDQDLRFPLAIGGIVDACQTRSIPYILAGVSAEGEWSRTAARTFRRAVKGAAGVYPRDVETASRLRSLSDGGESRLMGDFAGRFEREAGRPVSEARVGVNVKTAPDSHLEGVADLVAQLQATGLTVSLFTTGLPQDGRAMQKVVDRCNSDVSCFLPSTERELRRHLAGLDFVYGERLHAAILALDEGCGLLRESTVHPKVAAFLGAYRPEWGTAAGGEYVDTSMMTGLGAVADGRAQMSRHINLILQSGSSGRARG